jgi:hypothetical protein
VDSSPFRVTENLGNPAAEAGRLNLSAGRSRDKPEAFGQGSPLVCVLPRLPKQELKEIVLQALSEGANPTGFSPELKAVHAELLTKKKAKKK